MKCRICNSEIIHLFEAKEMVLGTKEIFTYGNCTQCKTLQINEIPKRLEQYYPNSYYSLSAPLEEQNYGVFKSLLLKKRDLTILGVKTSLLGYVMSRLKPAKFDAMYLAYAFVYHQLLSSKDIKIHDAGCGNGFFLKYFHDLGYKGLSGSDPFINHEINYGDYKIEQRELKSVEGTFDVILLNHVIEHVIDPLDYLIDIVSKLKTGGKCLIRTPMSTSIGFENYKENWVGLEPPRHLHIFDSANFIQLCKSVGLSCYEVKYDAIGWHYQASEAYKKDIALNAIGAQLKINASDLVQYQQMADQANAMNQGDTVAYYLKKI